MSFPEHVFHLVNPGVAVAAGLMFLVWLASMPLKNAGIVDIAWAYGFAILAAVYLSLTEMEGPRVYVIAAMAIAWSLRLGTYLLIRVAKHHPEEDGRYKTLREQFPKHTNWMFLGFFEAQALLLIILSFPFAMAMSNPDPHFGIFEILGFSVWLIAMLGEALADTQLNKWRSNPENKGRTCRQGLWRYSRHPNYFFQWLIWVGFWLYACGTPWGWITIYCPLLILFFLFKVTGIPTTEEHALKSRGDDYREYQRTTSVFIPWKPKT